MIDNSKLPFEENITTIHNVVEFAHIYSTTIKTELGKLMGIEDDLVINEKNSMYTNPDDTVKFIEATGIDTLTMAINTAHDLYKKTPKLDFNHLTTIRSKINLPLVLHGTSDVPNKLVKKAISLNIYKINVTTDLKIPFSNTIKEFFQTHPKTNNPHKYLTPTKEAMKKIVAHKIQIYNSQNRY